jgi:hypothetical protein
MDLKEASLCFQEVCRDVGLGDNATGAFFEVGAVVIDGDETIPLFSVRAE